MTDASVTESVFVVDDDPSIREGLFDLLDAAGLRTVSFGSAEDFVDHWTPDMS